MHRLREKGYGNENGLGDDKVEPSLCAVYVMASSGFLVFNPNEDDEISQGHQNTLILCVGELTDIVWASHLLCGRVCCGRVCLWANSLVTFTTDEAIIVY